MFRSAAANQSDLAMHRLAAHQESWRRSAGNWFDGSPDSVDNRIAKLDHILAFATDTAARLGSTEAGRYCVSSIPSLEQTRRELAAARDSLLNGFSDRQDASRPAGRRTARLPGDPHPMDEGAPNFSDYRGKCTECGSDNIDAAYYQGSGEYDCYDCGATFNPKVRRLRSNRRFLADDAGDIGVGPEDVMGAGGTPIGGGNGPLQMPAPMAGAPRPGSVPGSGGSGGGLNQAPSGFGSNPTVPSAPAPIPGSVDPVQPGPGARGVPIPPNLRALADQVTGVTGKTGASMTPIVASVVRAIHLGSRDFVADQNTDDRDELLYRARRYAAEETSTMPVPVARQITAAFVGTVDELIARRPRKRTAARQITAYEDFDDSLMY